MISKIIRIGYFWLTMQKDAREFVERCDKCQRFGNVQCIPAEKLTSITSLWPFAQWGIHIVGPLPQGKRQVKFLLVAIDYFTKWVEAEALLTITEVKIQNFVWADSGYHERSYQITNGSLTVKILETFAQDWGSRTNSHL